MVMQLKKASRKQAKIKIMISGPSGSGKTYSSLLLASGMAPWEKIALIDTERGSGDLYSDLGPYNTLTLESPFTPERYIEAINTCIAAGIEVIIIDSITHEWDGRGGILEIHEAIGGNSYTAWNKVTPRHNKFIDAILQSPVHLISTARSKQDYVLTEKNGKQVPEKVGMKSITREGFDYEVTIAFEININHNATVTKNRTNLFRDGYPFVISPETGKSILDWCTSGSIPEPSKIDFMKKKMDEAKTPEDLLKIGTEISQGDFSDYEKEVLRKHFVSTDIFKKNPDFFKTGHNSKPPAATTPNNLNGVQQLNLISEVAKEYSLSGTHLVRFTAFVNEKNGNSKAPLTKDVVKKMLMDYANGCAKANEELSADLVDILATSGLEPVTEEKHSEYDRIKADIESSNDKAFLYFIEDDIKSAGISDVQKRFLKSILDEKIKIITDTKSKQPKKARKGATA